MKALRVYGVIRVALLWAVATTLPVLAGAAPLVAEHKGYAFDKPRVLVQQRLFGLAHGVTLLAAACLADGAGTKGRDVLLAAYADWDKAQSVMLDEIQRDLARHYFGERSADAQWSDIAAATGLRLQLNLKPGSLEMMAACDSLPETLQKPRYDLVRQYRLQQLASRLAEATATEAHAQACRASLPEAASSELGESMQHWRDAYSPLVDEARTTLEQQWDASQLDGKLSDWLAQARDKGLRAARTATKTNANDANADAGTERNRPSCAMLAAWLLTSPADPDVEFNSRP